MLVYLDNCCYNRPYDDQIQGRVILETEAILGIIEKCEKLKNWIIVGSGDYTQERVQNNTIDEIAESIYKRKYS